MMLVGGIVLSNILPLRIWQQIHLVESDTGFWAVSNHATIWLLYIAMGLLLLPPLVAGLMQRNKIAVDLTRRPRMAEGVVAAIAAIGVAVGVAAALYFALSVFTGSATVADIQQPAENTMRYFIRTGAMAALLEALFGVGAAIFFCNLAVVNFMAHERVYVSRLLALMPVLWVVCRILRRFSRTISYLRVSDLFITLAALVLLMIFLMAFAQVLSGVNADKKEWRLLAAGIPAAALLLLGFLPRLVAYNFMDGLVPSQDAVIEWADPAIALFIAVFLFGRLRKKELALTPAEEQVPEPEEAPSPQEEQDPEPEIEAEA